MKLPLTIANAHIKVDRLVPGGQGIATLPADSSIFPGKKAFFWNALPGETVTDFTITKNKSRFLEAIVNKIENPSVHRIAPKDSCYLATSPWQILDYDYELTQKAELLTEIFSQHQIIIKDIAVKTDYRPYFYRNKMEYSLYWDLNTQKIRPAQHQRGSHRKIPLDSSSIEHPEIFAAATKIIDDLNARGEEARRYQSLLLRCNQNGKISGGLYENKKPHPVFKNLQDTLLGHKYSYSPNGFFQINLPVYELALKEIKKYILTSEILDLYAGVGSIGLSVANGRKLTLVECNPAAFSELEKNCAKLKNTSPILANSENTLDFISAKQTVILDPPRAGCHQKLITKLLEVAPPVIIYLSCNPATQARDLQLLLEKYRLEKVQPFNFFPRTPHLENLVILKLK